MLYKETSYLHRAVNNIDIDSHKEFLIEFINSLICRAKNEDTKHSVTKQATLVEKVDPVIYLNIHKKSSPIHKHITRIVSITQPVILSLVFNSFFKVIKKL